MVVSQIQVTFFGYRFLAPYSKTLCNSVFRARLRGFRFMNGSTVHYRRWGWYFFTQVDVDELITGVLMNSPVSPTPGIDITRIADGLITCVGVGRWHVSCTSGDFTAWVLHSKYVCVQEVSVKNSGGVLIIVTFYHRVRRKQRHRNIAQETERVCWQIWDYFKNNILLKAKVTSCPSKMPLLYDKITPPW